MTDNKKKRKVIRSEGREMIAKVFHFLTQEYQFMKEHNYDNCDLSPLANIRKRTAEATGVGESTVTKVLKEEKSLPSTSSRFPSPVTRRPRKNTKSDNNPNLEGILNAIKSYHKKHKEIPSLKKLKTVLEDKNDPETSQEKSDKQSESENSDDNDIKPIKIEY